MRAGSVFLSLGLLLLVAVGTSEGQSSNCRKPLANKINNGADIVVSTTPVTVMEANTARCAALIYNATQNPMRCRDILNDGIPSATLGWLISPGNWLSLTVDGQGQWQCIRVGTSDAAATVLEDRDLPAVLRRADVVVYATGSERIVAMLGPAARAFEYRHTPDPREIDQILLPTLDGMRGALATSTAGRPPARLKELP